MSKKWSNKFTPRELDELFLWLIDRSVDQYREFLESVYGQWKRKGDLSEKQWEAVKRSHDRLADRPDLWENRR